MTEMTQSVAREDRDMMSDAEDEAPRPKKRPQRVTAAGYLIILLSLALLMGFLAVRSYTGGQELRRQEAFIQTARSGSEMLTTVDADHVDDDVARIIAASTGPFLEDFQLRSEAFVDAVTKTQSKTHGTVLEAGLEEVRGDQADVLVTMAVTTSINGAQAQPRQWRMRIGVQLDGSTMKVSNVEFVP
ncbi:Mce-associated membrane protein [Mycolicibacterium sp. 624]